MELLSCCGSRRWAARVSAGRPYADNAALLAAADAAWDAATEADVREAFAAHPRIGEPERAASRSAASRPRRPTRMPRRGRRSARATSSTSGASATSTSSSPAAAAPPSCSRTCAAGWGTIRGRSSRSPPRSSAGSRARGCRGCWRRDGDHDARARHRPRDARGRRRGGPRGVGDRRLASARHGDHRRRRARAGPRARRCGCRHASPRVRHPGVPRGRRLLPRGHRRRRGARRGAPARAAAARARTATRRTVAADGGVLGTNQYGKAEVHMVTVSRDGARHTIRDLTVGIALSGDLADVHLTGDNAHVRPDGHAEEHRLRVRQGGAGRGDRGVRAAARRGTSSRRSRRSPARGCTSSRRRLGPARRPLVPPVGRGGRASRPSSCEARGGLGRRRA